MNSAIQVTSANHLSSENVRELIASGKEIVATPHIGNRWRSDMATPIYLGAKNVVFARNQSKKDQLDFPEFIRLNGEIVPFSAAHEQPKISPYLSLDNSELVRRQMDWILQYGNSPAQIHHSSAKALLGNEENRLDAKYLFLDDSKISELLEALAIKFPNLGIFDRFLGASWEIHLLRNGGHNLPSSRLKMVQKFQDFNGKIVNRILSGSESHEDSPIPQNAFMVLLLAIKSLMVEIENGNITPGQEKAEVFTISGESMAKYAGAKPFVEKMTEFYDAIRVIHPEFPEELKISYVPGAHLDIVPTTLESDLADMLRKYANIWQEMEHQTLQIRSTKWSARQEIIDKKWVTKNGFLEVRKDIKAILQGRKFFSQYDALASGSSILYVPELAALPLKEISPLIL